jgi:hypothetical protein
MMNLTKSEQANPSKLSYSIYRRFLMMTSAWPGSRAFPGSLILRLNNNKNGVPLYWCSQDPQRIMLLVPHLNIYSLRSTLNVIPSTNRNIQALAVHYVDEILNIQPQGPYYLGGICTGGYLAFEIAQQLMKRGRQIGLLALVEVDPVLMKQDITYNKFLCAIERYIHNYNNALRHYLDEVVLPANQPLLIPFKVFLWTLNSKRLVFHLKELINIFARQTFNYISSIGRSFFSSRYKTNIKVNKEINYSVKDQTPVFDEETGYKFTPYPGKIVLFFVKRGLFGYNDKIFQKYWKKLALKGIDFHFVPGRSHRDFDLNAIADLLQAYLGQLKIRKQPSNFAQTSHYELNSSQLIE